MTKCKLKCEQFGNASFFLIHIVKMQLFRDYTMAYKEFLLIPLLHLNASNSATHRVIIINFIVTITTYYLVL